MSWASTWPLAEQRCRSRGAWARPMPEGLSAGEVGKEIGEHGRHAAEAEARSGGIPSADDRRGGAAVDGGGARGVLRAMRRRSGGRSPRFRWRGRRLRARRRTAPTSRPCSCALRSTRSHSTPGSAAFIAGHATGERLAERRLRPGYRPAFHAWLATDPAHNSERAGRPGLHAPVCDPAGSCLERARQAGGRRPRRGYGGRRDAPGDKYVRDTVFLATVLFLVGISGHFRLRQARYGLIGVGVLMLVFAVVQVLGLPQPPA